MAKLSFKLINGAVIASDKELLQKVAVSCDEFKKLQKEFETDEDQSKGFIAKFPQDKRVYYVDSEAGRIIPCVIRLNANKTFRIIRLDKNGKTDKIDIVGTHVWTVKKEAQEELSKIAREAVADEFKKISDKAKDKIKQFSDKAAPVLKTGRTIAGALLDEFKEKTKKKVAGDEEINDLKERVDALCERSKQFTENVRKSLSDMDSLTEEISRLAITLTKEINKRDGRAEKK